MIHNLHRLPTPLGPAPKLKVEHVLRLQPNGGGLVDHLGGSQSEDSSSSSDDGNQTNNSSGSPNQRNASRRLYNHHHRHSTVPKTLALVESDDEENEHLLRLRRKSVGGSTLMSPKHKPAALPISAIQGLFTNTTSVIDPNNRGGKKEKVKVCSYIMRRVGGGGSSPPSSPPNHHHTSSSFSPTMSMTSDTAVSGGFNNTGAFGGTTSSMAYSRPGTTASSSMGGGGSRVGSRAGAPPTAYRHAKPFGTFLMGSNSTLQPPNLSRLSPALQRAISPAGVVTPIMLRAASSPCPRPQGIAAAIPSLQVSAAQQQAQAQLNNRNDDISSSSLQISSDAGYHTPFEGVPPLPSDFDHIGGCSRHIARFEQRQQARIDLDQAAVAARQISVGSAMSGMMQRSSSSLAAGGVSTHSRTTSRQHSLPLNVVTPPPTQPSQPPSSALTAHLHEEHVHIEEAVDRPPTHPSVLSSIQEQYTLPSGYMGDDQQRHHHRHQSHHYRGGGGDPLNGDEDGGGYGHGYEDDDDGVGDGDGEGDVSGISPHGSEGGWSGGSTCAPDVDADGRQLVGTLPRSVFQPPRVIKMLFNFTAVQRLPSIAILRKVGYPVLYERLLGASNKRRSSVSRQHYFNVMKELVPQMPVKDAVAILDCVDRTEHGDVDVDVLLLSVQMLLGSATPGDVLRFCIKALDPQSSEPRYISRYEIQSMLRAVQQLSTLGTTTITTNPTSSTTLQGGRNGSGGKPSLPSIVLTPGLINSAAAAVSKGGLPDTNNHNKSKNNSITGGGGGGSPTLQRRNTLMGLRGTPSSQHKKTGSASGSNGGEASEEAVDKEYTVMFAGISELLQDVNKYDRHGQMPLDSFISFLKDRLRLFGGPVVSAVDRRSFTGGSLSAASAGRLSNDSGDRVRPGGRVVVSGAAPGQGRGGVLDGARLIAPAHRLSSKVMILQHIHDSTTTGSSHTTS